MTATMHPRRRHRPSAIYVAAVVVALILGRRR